MKGLKQLIVIAQLLSLLILVAGFYVFVSSKDFTKLGRPVAASSSSKKTPATSTSKTSTSASSSDEEETVTVPEASLDDWELLLVNGSNRVSDFAPELGVVGPVYVDLRVLEAVTNFLAAAQAIDPTVHLVTGYRSAADQEVLYNAAVDQEVQVNGLSYEEAVEAVQDYIQPAGASDHQTGLAIDMGPVDMPNQTDPLIAKKIQALAPEYGFVLRYPQGKEEVTGRPYEDWHYRYVGVAVAKYLTANQLTLEEYIEEVRRAQE